MNARCSIILTTATRRAIDRARGITGPLRDNRGRIIPMDAITKALRAAATPDATIDMARFEQVYLRERQRELHKPLDSDLFEYMAQFADRGTDIYIAWYLAKRGLVRG